MSYAFDDFSTFKPTSPDDFTHLGAAGEGVVALKQYVVNAEGDPVLGPAIKQWVRLVRYDG